MFLFICLYKNFIHVCLFNNRIHSRMYSLFVFEQIFEYDSKQVKYLFMNIFIELLSTQDKKIIIIPNINGLY